MKCWINRQSNGLRLHLDDVLESQVNGQKSLDFKNGKKKKTVLMSPSCSFEWGIYPCDPSFTEGP